MKNFAFPLIILAFLVTACAQKHYSQMHGDRVSFYYKDKKANEVLFASSLENYKFLAARENNKHLWKVTVPAGKDFSYFYVVDGVIILPECAYTEYDDFGSRNCLYIADM